MKQNITLSMDKQVLKRVRAVAAKRGTSVTAMLAEELQTLVERDAAYERAKAQAIAMLDSPFHLGGARIHNRERLHDRKGLR